jgi:hypothetical protein
VVWPQWPALLDNATELRRQLEDFKRRELWLVDISNYVPGDPSDCDPSEADARVISDCHFRKAATEFDRKPGIKWLSGTAK